MAPNQRYALITGGSRGIGRGTALKFADAGIKAAVHYYNDVISQLDVSMKPRVLHLGLSAIPPWAGANRSPEAPHSTAAFAPAKTLLRLPTCLPPPSLIISAEPTSLAVG